jgi:hypothetical protein
MATEKSRGAKMSWQDLVVPKEKDARSRRQYKKMVRQYQAAMRAYRCLAFEFHQGLLKPKDFPKQDK